MGFVHRMLRKPFFGRFEAPWQWPTNASESDWQRHWFSNSRGARLAALWGGARGAHANAPRGTLVLAHPMGKAAKGFWLRQGHAQLFRDHGWNVFACDANGFGESEPSSFDYPDDFFCAGVEAQALAPERPVGLVGASFGAGWGLCAMSRAGHAFRFAVLEGAFPTLPEFWHHYPVAQAALRLSQVVAPSFERGLRPERDAARVIGAPPVLLLYGADDVYTTPTHGERMRAACATCTSAELHVLPDVQHTFALRDAPAQYRELVLCFLDGR